MYKPLFVLTLAALLSGCVYRPADIPIAKLAEAPGQHLYIYSPPAKAQAFFWQESARLASDLQKAGFIPSVVTDQTLIPEGAAVVESIEPRGECFSEPILTVFTLGVIPHIGCTEHGYKFKLRKSGTTTSIDVNAKFKVRQMVGWLTWPAALSKSYAYDRNASASQSADSAAISLLQREVMAALNQ